MSSKTVALIVSLIMAAAIAVGQLLGGDANAAEPSNKDLPPSLQAHPAKPGYSKVPDGTKPNPKTEVKKEQK